MRDITGTISNPAIGCIIGLLFIVLAGVSGCSSDSGNPSAYPGKLVGYELIGEYSAQEMGEVVFIAFSVTGEDLDDLLNSSTAVKAYAVEYYTRNVDGRIIVASGLVAVPNPAVTEYPVVSYLHGTMFNNLDVPSYPERPHSEEAFPAMALFAAHGYVAVMPDYIGQGRGSKVLHPYLHAHTTATSSADMLAAAAELCAQLKIELDTRLFICGLSQGGHATMALQRYLETAASAGPFLLTASAPIAGPYSVPLAWDFWQTNFPGASPLAAHLILAYKSIYGFNDGLSDIFIPPYDETIEVIDDGTLNGDEMSALLPKTLEELLRADFLLRVNNGTHPFRDAMEANNVYDFAPRIPVRLYHAVNDELCPYSISEFTRDHMIALGAQDVEIVPLGPEWSHESSFLPAMLSIKRWFDTL